MSRAEAHYRGRDLTAMTFGKRGGPAYARLYNKSVQADGDALIRRVWQRAGYDEDAHGRVWRVELELRSELLRTMAGAAGHLPTDPWELLAFHLDELWNHMLSKWLVLRAPGRSSRIERCPPQGWWVSLAAARGLNGEACGPDRDLARRPRPTRDCTPLLRQAAGLLASVAAANGADADLDMALDAFGSWMREAVGQDGFADGVRRAQDRLEDAERAGGWFPAAPATEPSADASVRQLVLRRLRA